MIFLRKKKDYANINFIEKIDKSKPSVKIGILNIMPTLEDTERQLLKVLDTPFLQVEVDFIYLESFTKDEGKLSYLKKYYFSFKEIANNYYDGIIITGAPLEHFSYADIIYIKEFNEFLEYTKKYTKNTLYLCWASEYALDYFYQVKSVHLPEKLSGLYEHYLVNESAITTSFDDAFYVPISRYCSISEKDILKSSKLNLISKSNIAGALLVENKEKSQLFMTGHLEYEKDTLELEYKRDSELKIRIKEPLNYYINGHINFKWQAHQYLFYHNWLYHYVYSKKYGESD